MHLDETGENKSPTIFATGSSDERTLSTVAHNSRAEEEQPGYTSPTLDYSRASIRIIRLTGSRRGTRSHLLHALFTTSWRATCRPTRRATSATSASTACAPTPRSKSDCCSPTGCRWRTGSASFSPPCPSPRDQCCRSGPPPRSRPA